MSMTFDPYSLRNDQVSPADTEVLMTNPTATTELEAYWSSLPKMRGIPARKDVDPSKMAGLLEDSFILERVAPGVARIRVAGRSVGKLLDMEPRGLPLTAAILPSSRMDMGRHIESAFMGPSIVEIPLMSPRAVGQPPLQGKILLLPLRDDFNRVSRLLGVLVMSGRRGLGGRRFDIDTSIAPRIDPIVGLHAIAPNEAAPMPRVRPSLRAPETKKAQDRPALRLVVSNP